MENNQEDIQKDTTNKIKNQESLKFMIEDISDENFIFTKREEYTKFLDGVNGVLNSYITAKQIFCSSLANIQDELNKLTEAKSTILQCTFIYKFTEMMNCYIK